MDACGEDLDRMVAAAFPHERVVSVEPMAGGMRNRHFQLRLEGRLDSVVLRIYEKDPSVCRKELALLRKVRETVPVPEVLHAEPDGRDGVGPFAFLKLVEGVTFRELARTGQLDALREAAFSAGAALAAIGRFEFPEPGRLGDELEVLGPFVPGPDPIPKFLDSCLASPHLLSRAGAELAERVHRFGWSFREALAALDGERRLVHGDFNQPNLLARPVGGSWRLAAVLDWEFALSGSPLFDFGNALRFERRGRPVLEPGFSQGFVESGGHLPPDGRRLARVIDLTALCEKLSRDDLPEAEVDAIRALVVATLDDRDPA